MHFTSPIRSYRSVKEFASHYAMIVLSILTAVTLEQAAIYVHHRAEARITKTGIEEEIQENRQRVAAAAKEVDDTLRVWRALKTRGVAQLKAQNSTVDERLQLLREAANNYRDGLPSLRTNAWDAALANQSINYLDEKDLKRFSEGYSAQKFFSQTTVSLALDGTIRNLSDLGVAVSTGSVDPLDNVRILDWRVRTLTMIQSNIVQLDKALAQAATVK